jgi:7-cyano-7-deazaguanine synthase
MYVRFGLSWESVEQSHLQSFLKSIAGEKLADLLQFDLPMREIYQNHWSTTGTNVPDASTDDAAVYLPGRNILLISKAAVWCALNNVSIIALGSLARNPFADATDSFFESLEKTLSMGLAHDIRIVRPLQKMHKQEVLEAGRHLPLHLSFSCIQPVQLNGEYIHCGRCNKCEERMVAFKQTDFQDQTKYATDKTKVSSLCIK